MARKSRKPSNQTVTDVKTSEKVFNTAIYVRLSRENSLKDDDGESIENQVRICEKYLLDKPYLKLAHTYVDNGAVGTHFDRPEFNKMIEGVKANKIDCIIVKDLSRFGRNYIETGNYLESIFPFLGVRFIAVIDGYDSDNVGTGDMMLSIKNLMNSLYAKDISKKICTSFDSRKAKGEFLPANLPYGYLRSKTKTYRYDIDDEVADNIRLIFIMRAEGSSYNTISQKLTDIGAVTPARRKYDLGLWHSEKYKNTTWFGRSIIDILKNPVYIGHLVYGKIPKGLYKGITKSSRAKEEDWQVLEYMHEPIVEEEIFYIVQSLFEKNKKSYRPKRKPEKDILKGYYFCGICGKRIRGINKTHLKGRVENGFKMQYQCGGYLDSRRSNCSNGKSLYSTKLYPAIHNAIKKQIEIAINARQMIDFEKAMGYDADYKKITSILASLRVKINRISDLKKKLYEDYASGLLDAEEYFFSKRELEERIVKFLEEKQVLEEKYSFYKGAYSNDNKWLKLINEFQDSEVLDERIIKAFVNKIYGYEGDRFEIVFNFQDQFDILIKCYDITIAGVEYEI